MTLVEELAEVDAEWDAISSDVADRPAERSNVVSTDESSQGLFGHAWERRLGLRVPAACWVLLTDGAESTYARTVELSANGSILKLLDRHRLRVDGGQHYTLDIFVPGVDRPVRATARLARTIGVLHAFEFSNINAVDRLTLAEHLDDLVVQRSAPSASEASARAGTPPLAWRRFVLSLKQPTTRTPATTQRF